MSGIVGIINLDGRQIDRQLLQRMTEFMDYRGPDVRQIWTDGPVGFGHTMLRTTFESEFEQQPCSLDGQVWITADARIDGRKELVSELERKGLPKKINIERFRRCNVKLPAHDGPAIGGNDEFSDSLPTSIAGAVL